MINITTNNSPRVFIFHEKTFIFHNIALIFHKPTLTAGAHTTIGIDTLYSHTDPYQYAQSATRSSDDSQSHDRRTYQMGMAEHWQSTDPVPVTGQDFNSS